MKILKWICKIIVLISSITLLGILIFPSFIFEIEGRVGDRVRGFVLLPPNRMKIDFSLHITQIISIVVIIFACSIFLKWQSSKKSGNNI